MKTKKKKIYSFFFSLLLVFCWENLNIESLNFDKKSAYQFINKMIALLSTLTIFLLQKFTSFLHISFSPIIMPPISLITLIPQSRSWSLALRLNFNMGELQVNSGLNYVLSGPWLPSEKSTAGRSNKENIGINFSVYLLLICCMNKTSIRAGA